MKSSNTSEGRKREGRDVKNRTFGDNRAILDVKNESELNTIGQLLRTLGAIDGFGNLRRLSDTVPPNCNIR